MSTLKKVIRKNCFPGQGRCKFQILFFIDYWVQTSEVIADYVRLWIIMQHLARTKGTQIWGTKYSSTMNSPRCLRPVLIQLQPIRISKKQNKRLLSVTRWLKKYIILVERESTNMSLVKLVLPVSTVRSRVNLIISFPPGNLLNLIMFTSCVSGDQPSL